jgi:single-stranded-DNA-specific exonuclease
MNLASALMAVGNHLVKFGGHELAAGLSVTRGMLDTFRREINAYAREHLSDEAIVQSVYADAELTIPEMTMELAKELCHLEPFGTGNPVPAFVVRGAVVHEIVPISGGKHSKLIVGDGVTSLQAMCFGMSPSSLDVFVGDRADLLFTLDINEWAGRRTLQMIVKDIRRSDEVDRQRDRERARFDEIWNGGKYTAEEKILPSREHFAAVYLLLRSSIRSGVDCMSHRALLARLYPILPGEIGYVRLKLILRILQELGLLDFEEMTDETYRFSMDPQCGRTDLEKSHLLRRIRSQLLKSE